MSAEETYRIVELRKNCRPVVIGMGLSKQIADRIRQRLSSTRSET